MTEEIEFEVGSGNVFADIGLPNADELQVKANLVHKIREVMRERKLTQAAIAEIIGVTQPAVSDMMRGKFHLVSVYRLMQHLVALGHAVEIVVQRHADAAHPAQLSVSWGHGAREAPSLDRRHG